MDLLQTVRKEGSRGGRAEFKWEDVKNDAQRENYLGHSLMAPVGRWQQNKDLSWYAKGDTESRDAEAARIKEEKRKLKEAEEDAMLAAMGLPVPERNNANLTPLGAKAHEADVKEAIEEKAKGGGDDEDKARRRDKKERSRRHRDDGDRERRRRYRSRSRSQDRDRRHRHRDRSTSRARRRDGDRERDRRRHRSRSREHRRRDDRAEPRRERKPDERPSPSPSHSRDRRRRRDSRSRSPYKAEKRRD